MVTQTSQPNGISVHFTAQDEMPKTTLPKLTLAQVDLLIHLAGDVGGLSIAVAGKVHAWAAYDESHVLAAQALEKAGIVKAQTHGFNLTPEGREAIISTFEVEQKDQGDTNDGNS